MENNSITDDPQANLEATGPEINSHITDIWKRALWRAPLIPAAILLPDYWCLAAPALAAEFSLRANGNIRLLRNSFETYSSAYANFVAKSKIDEDKKFFLIEKAHDIGERLREHRNLSLIGASFATMSAYLGFEFIPMASNIAESITDTKHILAAIFTFTVLNTTRKNLEHTANSVAKEYQPDRRDPDAPILING